MSDRPETTPTPRGLPSWEGCCIAVKSGTCTRLEQFIHEYEPAGVGDKQWREMLAALLDDPEKAIDV